MTGPALVAISHLGARGEGVAQSDSGRRLYVPYAVPGDEVRVEIDGERGRLVEIVAPGANRIAPFCPHFGDCGGCAVQTLARTAYGEWKRGLVLQALAREGLTADVGPLIDGHGAGRRRATFHARYDASHPRRAKVGFMAAREHRLVDIDQCPILCPSMSSAPQIAREIARSLASIGKPLDIAVLGASEGLDVEVRGAGRLGGAQIRALIGLGQSQDLARLANHGDILVTRRAPSLQMGRAQVYPPPGAFVQSTMRGEELIAQRVCEAIGEAGEVVDLFAGVGTLTLRLAERARVHAVDADAAALASLLAAARQPEFLPVTTEPRDLFRRPLTKAELDRYDAVVIDPPRAGALAQTIELAKANAPRVVYVSCAPATFARDAAQLVAAGYRLESLSIIDQFRHAPHVELVGAFGKPKRKTRRLLG